MKAFSPLSLPCLQLIRASHSYFHIHGPHFTSFRSTVHVCSGLSDPPPIVWSRVFPQPSRAAAISRGSVAGPVKTKARAPNMEEENEITGPEAEPEMGHGGLQVTGFLSGRD